eukprot:COSAG06_NODE_2714_length_6403_cov_23.366593_3_plen_108_part_00
MRGRGAAIVGIVASGDLPSAASEKGPERVIPKPRGAGNAWCKDDALAGSPMRWDGCVNAVAAAARLAPWRARACRATRAAAPRREVSGKLRVDRSRRAATRQRAGRA